jgi:photosynthetic reaction center cytochrome c subunit
MRITSIALWTAVALSVLGVLAVPNWHWPLPGRQVALSGPSLIQFPQPDRGAAVDQTAPPPLPPAQGDTRPATQVYRDVEVLTDTSAAEFMRMQQAITQWVAPREGCGFCHVAAAGGTVDYVSNANPRKAMARLMFRMTRHANAGWSSHVGAGGVTCFTCHRGQPVPSEVWLRQPPSPGRPMIARQDDWHESAATVREFFPTAGFDEYLLQQTPGVAQSYTALPSGQAAAQVVVKRLYEYMMQMAQGIGVNCGYCHNSRAFFDWDQSTPERWSGYSGIALTRDLDRNFLLPAATVLPQASIVPGAARSPIVPEQEAGMGAGSALVVCATCHHREPKPLSGADLLAAYPALRGPDTDAGVASPLPPLAQH